MARWLFLLALLAGPLLRLASVSSDCASGQLEESAALGDVDTEEDQDPEDAMLPPLAHARLMLPAAPAHHDAHTLLGCEPAPPVVPPPIVL